VTGHKVQRVTAFIIPCFMHHCIRNMGNMVQTMCMGYEKVMASPALYSTC